MGVHLLEKQILTSIIELVNQRDVFLRNPVLTGFLNIL